MSLTIAVSSVAEMLKNETRIQHQQAEDLLVHKLSCIKSVKEYTCLLKMFYGFYHPLEETAHSFIPRSVLKNIASRKKSAWILQDLTEVGDNDVIPLCNHLPKIHSTEQALGCLYVLEGSTLGGRVIMKMLQAQQPQFFTGEVLHFFNGYGEETSSKWIEFKSVLDQYIDNVEEIVASANETFSLFHNWIKKSLYNE
jgi:heme oxygenase (biliverdin-IX-beta and delta-forming)